MGALYFIFCAAVGGAIMGATVVILARGIRLIFPPKAKEEKDPVEEQLKASEEWLRRDK